MAGPRIIPDYEATRPAWVDAGPWDRAVLESRARAELGHPHDFYIHQDGAGRFAMVDQRTGRSVELP